MLDGVTGHGLCYVEVVLCDRLHMADAVKEAKMMSSPAPEVGQD